MRCEGCQRLYCLPCMSKHQDELGVEFQLLSGVQKELKHSFEIVQSNWQNRTECPCLVEIDRWEEEILARVRRVADQARVMANEMMMKNMADIRRKLDQLAFDIEQRQEEGNYLDKDIAEVKRQLEQLNGNIENIHARIRINSTLTKKIDWNNLISVTIEKKSMDNQLNALEFQDEQDDRPENLWRNLRKFIRNKQMNIDYRSRHESFKPNSTSMDRSVTLTGFDSSECSSTSTAEPSKQSSIFRNDSLNHKNFVSINHDQFLPQGTDV